jgi:glutathione S-transferase
MRERSERVLYQFPVSHYCEKSRWNLDAKGLPYATRDLLPGVHLLVLKRIARNTTVPVLVDRGRVVADSTHIALHLDEAYPERRLIPHDASERRHVLELEDWFDREAGPSVRQYVYGQLLQTPGVAASVFFARYGAGSRVLGAVLGSAFERGLRRAYRIAPDTVREAQARALACIDRLESLIDGDPQRYLVGRTLTIADITAASLLGPLLTPPESPWPVSNAPSNPQVQELRASLRTRPAGQWVLARYQHDRLVKAIA